MKEHAPTIFEKFVMSRPFGKRNEFRNALMKRIEPRISDQTYRNWENGQYEPSETYRDTINMVAIDIYGELVY